MWGDEHDITAVEYDKNIAAFYSKLYPNDTVVIADAHQYLLEHFAEFDLIWSSPPCPTHGQFRYNIGYKSKGYSAVFPDMKLYEEIIFLKHYFKGLWLVENVRPYYKPLIEPTATLQRHILWSNFTIPDKKFATKNIRSRNKLSDYPEYDLSNSGIKNKIQVHRNCVDPELGLHILDQLNTNLTDRE